MVFRVLTVFANLTIFSFLRYCFSRFNGFRQFNVICINIFRVLMGSAKLTFLRFYANFFSRFNGFRKVNVMCDITRFNGFRQFNDISIFRVFYDVLLTVFKLQSF